MSETHFHWPGRYTMWREGGVLLLEVEAGPPAARQRFRHALRPRHGYQFLMARRRTELLYAIAEAMAADGMLDEPAFADLVETCALAEEGALSALADRWNADGRVASILGLLLGAVPARWFAPVARR